MADRLNRASLEEHFTRRFTKKILKNKAQIAKQASCNKGVKVVAPWCQWGRLPGLFCAQFIRQAPSKPAARIACASGNWLASVSGVIGRRMVAPQSFIFSIAHLMAMGFGSTNKCLCTGSSFI